MRTKNFTKHFWNKFSIIYFADFIWFFINEHFYVQIKSISNKFQKAVQKCSVQLVSSFYYQRGLIEYYYKSMFFMVFFYFYNRLLKKNVLPLFLDSVYYFRLHRINKHCNSEILLCRSLCLVSHRILIILPKSATPKCYRMIFFFFPNLIWSYI